MEVILNSYVIHLPHSGILIPQEYVNDYYLSTQVLQENIFEYADYLTDELYAAFVEKCPSIVNPYSRLFMDPERFFDDTEEMMHTKYKIGWFYENAILEKTPLRSVRHKEEIAKYYKEHHERLLSLVETSLTLNEECTIIDCHSFSDRLYWFHEEDLHLPEICIGFDQFHKNEHLVEALLNEFKEYEVAINSPYAGSLVPMEHYHKDPRVKSVMIEVNKKLYLEADNVTKSEGFLKIQNHLRNVMMKLS